MNDLTLSRPFRSLRSFLLSVACCVILSACGSGGSSGSLTPPSNAPADNSGAVAPSPQFNPSTVHVSTIPVFANQGPAEVIAADAGGALYYGSFGNPPGFCLYVDSFQCNSGPAGTGSAGAIRYNGTGFTLTQPRGPYFESSPEGPTCGGMVAPNQNSCSFGEVSAIDATDFASVVWASDYAPSASSIFFSRLQWGASGGTAATPPPMFNHDFEQSALTIVSILRASNGQIWLGAGGIAPGLYPASIPAVCQGSQPPCDLFFLTNGPGDNVWAMTRSYDRNTSSLPIGSTFFEYSPSGSLIKSFSVPDVAVRIAGTPSAIWFTDYAHNAVGTIDGTGKVTEYPVPTANAGPYGIAVAADKSVWFTEYNAGKVGRIDSTGHIDEFAVPIQPFSIAATPAGCATPAIWLGGVGPATPLVKITGGN